MLLLFFVSCFVWFFNWKRINTVCSAFFFFLSNLRIYISSSSSSTQKINKINKKNNNFFIYFTFLILILYVCLHMHFCLFKFINFCLLSSPLYFVNSIPLNDFSSTQSATSAVSFFFPFVFKEKNENTKEKQNKTKKNDNIENDNFFLFHRKLNEENQKKTENYISSDAVKSYQDVNKNNNNKNINITNAHNIHSVTKTNDIYTNIMNDVFLYNIAKFRANYEENELWREKEVNERMEENDKINVTQNLNIHSNVSINLKNDTYNNNKVDNFNKIENDLPPKRQKEKVKQIEEDENKTTYIKMDRRKEQEIDQEEEIKKDVNKQENISNIEKEQFQKKKKYINITKIDFEEFDDYKRQIIHVKPNDTIVVKMHSDAAMPYTWIVDRKLLQEWLHLECEGFVRKVSSSNSVVISPNSLKGFYVFVFHVLDQGHLTLQFEFRSPSGTIENLNFLDVLSEFDETVKTEKKLHGENDRSGKEKGKKQSEKEMIQTNKYIEHGNMLNTLINTHKNYPSKSCIVENVGRKNLSFKLYEEEEEVDKKVENIDEKECINKKRSLKKVLRGE